MATRMPAAFHSGPKVQFGDPAGQGHQSLLIDQSVTSSVNIPVQLVDAHPGDGDVTVYWRVSTASTAEEGVDYTIATSSPLTFTDPTTEQNIVVTILDPANFGRTKTLRLKLYAVTGTGVIRGRSVFTLQITNPVAPPDADFTAGSGSCTVGVDTEDITVSIPAATREDTVIDISYSGGTKGVDFSVAGATWDDSVDTVTIPKGSTSATFTVTPLSASTVTFTVNMPTDNTERNLMTFSHDFQKGCEVISDPLRDSILGATNWDDELEDSSASGMPTDWIYGCDDNVPGMTYDIVTATGVYLPNTGPQWNGWNGQEAAKFVHRDKSETFGCVRKSFAVSNGTGTAINLYSTGGAANLTGGGTHPAGTGNNLFALLVHKGDADHCEITLFDRTKQSEGDPDRQYGFVVDWDGAGVATVSHVEDLDAGNGDDWGIVDVGGGWYILWVLKVADSDENDHVLNYFFKTNHSDSGSIGSQTGLGTIVGAAHFEKDGLTSMTGLADFQRREEYKWFAATALKGSTNPDYVLTINS